MAIFRCSSDHFSLPAPLTLMESVSTLRLAVHVCKESRQDQVPGEVLETSAIACSGAD